MWLLSKHHIRNIRICRVDSDPAKSGLFSTNSSGNLSRNSSNNVKTSIPIQLIPLSVLHGFLHLLLKKLFQEWPRRFPQKAVRDYLQVRVWKINNYLVQLRGFENLQNLGCGSGSGLKIFCFGSGSWINRKLIVSSNFVEFTTFLFWARKVGSGSMENRTFFRVWVGFWYGNRKFFGSGFKIRFGFCKMWDPTISKLAIEIDAESL